MLARFFARRRREAAITTLKSLGTIRSVLVLCTANRVRSPYAAAYLAKYLPRSITVNSRGVLAGGHPATLEAVMLAAELGMDLNRHTSRRLKPTELVPSQLVLLIEDQMRGPLTKAHPAIRTSLLYLGDFDPDHEGRDIEDPMDLTMADYRASFARIRRCCDAVLHLLPKAPPTPAYP